MLLGLFSVLPFSSFPQKSVIGLPRAGGDVLVMSFDSSS